MLELKMTLIKNTAQISSTQVCEHGQRIGAEGVIGIFTHPVKAIFKRRIQIDH